MQRFTYNEKNRDELLQYNNQFDISKKWFELPLNRKTLLRICFNTMWFLRCLSRVFLVRKKNPCYFCHFCDICGHFGALSSLSKSWFFLDLLFLRFWLYLSPVFSASKKNPCCFCDFCGICGHFGVLLVSFFSKSWFLLDLLFLRFLRYVWVIFWHNFSQLFLLRQLRKQFANKCLLTRSILDISDPSRPWAEADSTHQDLHNSSMIRKPNSIIVLLFIQNNS